MTHILLLVYVLVIISIIFRWINAVILLKFSVFLICFFLNATYCCYRADSNEDGRITKEEIKEVILFSFNIEVQTPILRLKQSN